MSKSLEGCLLISDLDGTMLDENSRIPENNLRAVRRFVEKGGIFTIATGRTVESARRYVEQLPVNAPVCVMNGSLLYDYRQERIVWEHPLPPEAKQYARQVLECMPDIGVEFSSGRQLYVLRGNDITWEHVKFEGLPYVKTTLDEVPPVWHKVLYGAPSDRMVDVMEFCNRVSHHGVTYVATSPQYYEMLPEGSNKGETLGVLARMLKIALDKTFAIGDYYNDRELVRKAGCGALAANAPKELYPEADLIVRDHTQGAVADFVGKIECGTIFAQEV
ncbi:HAD family hydrolase [Solibaculum mannosilyticum]|uniref:HAD family hydrolase n=1 Tax=Solibaculum mannosilyticum TaxID=2780922 RepID=UPI0007A862A9|nr:Pyridoxal phosphate phosphatase YbhA [Eubacteriaceae bacterium CHKCI005]